MARPIRNDTSDINVKNNLASVFKKNDAGFSLIEVVVVMGILAMIGAMTAVVNIDTYRGYLFRSERNLTLTVLHKARSQAISNVCMGIFCSDGLPHGVHFNLDGSNNLLGYVIFQGASYAGRDTAVDEPIFTSGNVQYNGPEEIIFEQLSGKAVSNPVETWVIILNDATGHSGTIRANSEGMVDWDNITVS